LAYGSEDKTIKLWSMESLKIVAELRGHKMKVLAIAFSPDSKSLASGSSDKSVKLWNI
jgi:WD40 repeat protein